MSATGYTPISLYYSTTASAVPVNTNLVNGELAINITDGKLYYKNNSGTVTLLAAASGASGDVVGPASATDTAVALFDGTTGKLIKNSPVTIGTTGNTVISGTDNSNAMLRITQLGTGDALLVEDSTNPDASPFVIDASGNVIQGYTTPLSFTAPVGTITPLIQSISQASSLTQGIVSTTHSASANGPNIVLAKSRGASASAPTIVNAQDFTGNLVFDAYDGTSYIPTAYISSSVDGTPGTSDMPGRLGFWTTADGASTPTERMRIDSAGNVSIGSGTATGVNLNINKTITGATTSFGARINAQVQSDVVNARYFSTSPSTQATSFTLTSISHFYAEQSTIGAGSVVTNQYGFVASSALTGATNNYGFYGNIAAASGRYNFYAAGTADNYFAGNVGVGTTSPTSGLQTAGSSSKSAFKTPNIAEVNTISATAATGTINYDVTTQSVLYYTTNASGNFTVNFRGSSGTSLNTVMQTGESISATFLVTNGSTAYYNSAVQVDGSSVTPKWQGGTAPTSGNASSIDSYTYVIIKVGSASFTVLASVTKFA